MTYDDFATDFPTPEELATQLLDQASLGEHEPGSFTHVSWERYDNGTHDLWWVVPIAKTTVSDLVEESNYHVALGALNEADGNNVGHYSTKLWVGSVTVEAPEVLVHDEHGELTDAFRKAHELVLSLAEYPILDEDDLSMREYDQLADFVHTVVEGALDRLDFEAEDDSTSRQIANDGLYWHDNGDLTPEVMSHLNYCSADDADEDSIIDAIPAAVRALNERQRNKDQGVLFA